MFTVDELLRAVEDYQHERMSLDAFEQWFEENSAMEFAEAEVSRMRAAVDAALGEYHFDHIGERAFRKELANAIRPFEQSQLIVVSSPLDKPPQRSGPVQPVEARSSTAVEPPQRKPVGNASSPYSKSWPGATIGVERAAAVAVGTT